MASRVAVVRAKYLSGWIGPSDASRSTAEPVALFGTQSALASGPQEAGEGPSYARKHSWKELQQALNALESRLPEANEQSTDQVLTACGVVHALSPPAQAASAGAFWPTRRAAVSPDNRGAGKWQLQSRELPPPVIKIGTRQLGRAAFSRPAPCGEPDKPLGPPQLVDQQRCELEVE